ncbi:MBL fold metallo-hydrolase [Salinarimonas sp. NSM]|uniref:MBL fold metallo-hydrolase n=1 Tax=Salinarimonas sp. NSM TaxID=3458003 RepID=UPI0040373C44
MAEQEPRLGAAIVPVTPFQQNCSVLFARDTMRGVVVDPGGDVPRILEAIRQTGVTIEAILITHGHVDHVSGVEELRDALKVPVIGPHPADAMFMDESLTATSQAYGLPPARPVRVDRWLDEGDTVDVGGIVFDVLHTPGHSPGSITYVSKADRFALVGDVVFAGSIGRTDLPGGDHEQLIETIRTKLLPLGDDVAFLCGHGPMSTLGQERQTNPFLVG